MKCKWNYTSSVMRILFNNAKFATLKNTLIKVLQWNVKETTLQIKWDYSLIMPNLRLLKIPGKTIFVKDEVRNVSAGIEPAIFGVLFHYSNHWATVYPLKIIYLDDALKKGEESDDDDKDEDDEGEKRGNRRRGRQRITGR